MSNVEVGDKFAIRTNEARVPSHVTLPPDGYSFEVERIEDDIAYGTVVRSDGGVAPGVGEEVDVPVSALESGETWHRC